MSGFLYFSTALVVLYLPSKMEITPANYTGWHKNHRSSCFIVHLLSWTQNLPYHLIYDLPGSSCHFNVILILIIIYTKVRQTYHQVIYLIHTGVGVGWTHHSCLYLYNTVCPIYPGGPLSQKLHSSCLCEPGGALTITSPPLKKNFTPWWEILLCLNF